MTDPGPATPDTPDRCDPVWEITPRRVHERLDGGEDLLLLDCRTETEAQVARIAGSRLVPMDDLAVHLDDLHGHETSPIVVYCRTGRRSLAVTAALRELGFEDVRSMAGGIHRWSEEVDPSVPTT